MSLIRSDFAKNTDYHKIMAQLQLYYVEMKILCNIYCFLPD